MRKFAIGFTFLSALAMTAMAAEFTRLHFRLWLRREAGRESCSRQPCGLCKGLH